MLKNINLPGTSNACILAMFQSFGFFIKLFIFRLFFFIFINLLLFIFLF